MSNENKTALTAEKIFHEVFIKHFNYYINPSARQAIYDAAIQFASLQTQEKDKEIAELKAINEGQAMRIGMYLNTDVDNLQSTIESQQKELESFGIILRSKNDQLDSQQKEIEELKGNAKEKGKECFEYYKECCNQSKRIKDLDECNRVTINRLLIMKEWLNPVPHTDVEACLNSINHAIQAINELLPKQETSNTQTPNTQPENNFTTCHNCTSDLLCKAQKQCNLINH